MRIMVTGSEGFIGKELVATLVTEGHEVVGVDLKASFPKDVLWLTCADLNGVDAIVHLAGMSGVRESFDDPESYMKNNVEATDHLSKIARLMNIPFLYASSSTAVNWDMHPYGASKRMCEIACAGREQVGMRFTTVYGHTARDNMLFGRMFNDTLEYVTDHVRDFILVDDVCEAIMALIKNYDAVPEIVDVGTGYGVSVKKLVKPYFDVPVKDGEYFEAQQNIADPYELQELGVYPTANVYYFMETNFDRRF